jgi:hypothetical protein
MKLKFLTILIGLMVLCLAIVGQVRANPTTLYLDPGDVRGPPPNIGGEFTLTLRVDAVSDLYLWVATIEWDPKLLALAENPVEGGCLKYGGYSTVFLWASIVPGKIVELTCTRLGVVPGADVPPAPNDLASIKFRVLNYSCETPITITFSKMLSSVGLLIDHEVSGSKFTLLPSFIYSSDASGVEKNTFIIGEDVYVTVPATGETVTLYVTTNRAWISGDSFEVYKVVKVSNVELSYCTVWDMVHVWAIPNNPSFAGNWYDIALDRNNNGIYDNGDLIDDVTVAGGFFVIADLPLGTLFGLSASLLAFAAFRSRRRSKEIN